MLDNFPSGKAAMLHGGTDAKHVNVYDLCSDVSRVEAEERGGGGGRGAAGALTLPPSPRRRTAAVNVI